MTATGDTIVEGRYENAHGARRYRLWIPEGTPPGTGRPLVLMLHGCTQDAEDFAAGTRMGQRSLREGWLALFPEQPPEAHPQRCWRWYAPDHQGAEAGEPALLAGLLDEVAAEHGADPERAFLAGVSAGGAMAAVLAATHPERFRAVVVHSGVPYRAAVGPQQAMTAMRGRGPGVRQLADRLLERLDGRSPPPLLVVHGQEDEAVDPVNGLRLAGAWLAATGRTAAEGPEPADRLPEPDVDRWRGERGSRRWRLRAWTGGEPRVELRTVEGLGHAWSGGAPAGSYTDPDGPSATDWAVDFFRRAAGDDVSEEGDRPEDREPRE